MKKRKNKKKTAQAALFSLPGMANDFTRGFVSYAAVAALAGARGFPVIDARLLRQSALAGAALAAGVAAGNAVERGDYLAAALVAAGGVAGVHGLSRLLELSFGEGT
ncbi:MAG: hypothetical protein LBU11_03960 [Zoogloeaceae bacterium]|jgi:hypothetical protein|nr:hypothetical protein [Zoogloeaceae bacterium]